MIKTKLLELLTAAPHSRAKKYVDSGQDGSKFQVHSVMIESCEVSDSSLPDQVSSRLSHLFSGNVWTVTDLFEASYLPTMHLSDTLMYTQSISMITVTGIHDQAMVFLKWEELAWVRHSSTWEEYLDKFAQKPNVVKKPGKVRARTYGTKSPSRSEPTLPISIIPLSQRSGQAPSGLRTRLVRIT